MTGSLLLVNTIGIVDVLDLAAKGGGSPPCVTITDACSGVGSDLAVVRAAIEREHPHIAFNLVEQFDDRRVFAQHVVSYLELSKQKYTGCNPRGLTIARDKALTKKILTYHGANIMEDLVGVLNAEDVPEKIVREIPGPGG